jgi:hypothetical protein
MENKKYEYIKELKMKLEGHKYAQPYQALILRVIHSFCHIAYLIANNMLPTSNPTEKEWLGVSVHSLSANEAQIVNASGARWIRIDVFPEFEAAIKNAKAQNLKVLAILDSWMFDQQTTFTLEEWRDNVTHYVSQYANDVDAWEIWNEPANPNYTLSTKKYNSTENMSQIVEFYFSMVEIASPIIRDYDPSAKIVLLGGLNLWSGDDPHLGLDKNFAQQLADIGIEQYGDAISVHAYPWNEQIPPLIWEKYSDSLAFYRELYPSLEIWVTETGHPIDFGGESAQAQYMNDSLDYFEGKVTMFFWYSLVDNAWEDKSFGLINSDETPRLAYYELKTS